MLPLPVNPQCMRVCRRYCADSMRSGRMHTDRKSWKWVTKHVVVFVYSCDVICYVVVVVLIRQ